MAHIKQRRTDHGEEGLDHESTVAWVDIGQGHGGSGCQQESDGEHAQRRRAAFHIKLHFQFRFPNFVGTIAPPHTAVKGGPIDSINT
jgi:hypothetical protein